MKEKPLVWLLLKLNRRISMFFNIEIVFAFLIIHLQYVKSSFAIWFDLEWIDVIAICWRTLPFLALCIFTICNDLNFTHKIGIPCQQVCFPFQSKKKRENSVRNKFVYCAERSHFAVFSEFQTVSSASDAATMELFSHPAFFSRFSAPTYLIKPHFHCVKMSLWGIQRQIE